MSTLRRAIFASTMIAGFAMAASVMAQEAPPSPASGQTPAEADAQKAAQQAAQQAARKNATPATSVGELVVTGSRIRTTAFTSPSPITVITPEQAQLTGTADIAQLLQQSPVANNSLQINNFFTGFEVGGGPGVNTLSLRGLGAQRTLFLINGQRLGPAGVGGTVGPVDLNTIDFPEAELSDIQILKDGASSIYGSDAIGGVVNIITKTDFNGGDLRAYYGPSQDGGANFYTLEGVFGKTWSRGYVTVGASWYKQTALTYNERPFLSCSSDDVTDVATGQRADVIDPTTGQYKCFNTFTNVAEDLDIGTVYRPLAGAVAGGGVTGFDIPGWQAVDQTVCNNAGQIFVFFGTCAPGGVNVAATRTSVAETPFNSQAFLNSTAVSPDERYMFNLFAGFDLTPHVKLYGSLILTQRDSSQVQVAQLFSAVNPGNVFNPGFGFPLFVVPLVYNASQKVDYGRATLGVKGDFPDYGFFKNWNYDLYGEFSQSHGYYTQPYVLEDRVNATAGSAGGTGCDPNANIDGGFTMAQLEPNVACMPVNYFQAIQNGGLSQAEQAFLMRNETGWTIYNHFYVEGSAGGDLFRLPGGPLGVNVGFQLRREEIDDNPPTDVQDGNDYNFESAGRTAGSETVKEAFGELRAPLLSNMPLVKSLVFTASGRYSDYTTFGSTITYKVGLDWELTDWLTIRGTQETGFRAPALYELFLADQSGFLGQQSIDPCINYATSGVSLNVQKNCASQGIPGNYLGVSPVSNSTTSAEILTGGGAANHLQPETSLSRTIGVVVAPKWFGLDLSIAADYYTFDVKNQIQQFGAGNILFQCYNSPTFPNSPFCSLFTRDLTPGSQNFDEITLVNNNYVNVAEQIDQGLDVTARYRANLPADIKLTIDTDLAWTFYTNTILLGGLTNNFLGQVSQPAFVGYVNFRFDKGPWTFNYFLNMVGHTDDNSFVPSIDPNYLQTGEAVFLNHVEPFYTTSTVSVRRTFKDFTATIGVRNVFDKTPGLYSTEGFQNRNGQFPLASQYDLIGRSFFVDLEKKF